MKIIKWLIMMILGILLCTPLFIYTLKLSFNFWGWLTFFIQGILIYEPLEKFSKWFNSKLK